MAMVARRSSSSALWRPLRHLAARNSPRALSTHVSVIGLHWKTDETRLRQAFEAYGNLEQARVLTPEHSSTHLWASLVYATFDEAFEAASEMNGQELDGRLLRVSIVDPPTAGESESDNDASEPRQ
uniref:RRM domain-containing protein n=1 Tax=Globisporangium ultimum (strain ATCC 200006 / CBS 805.95 / DAOM BR144) TaxID=431595 RepID=K3WEU7_GLOUD